MAEGARRDGDLALWAAAQARLLRAGRFSEVDAPGLADEVERLGARQGEALVKRLAALVARLLLWRHMPGARLPSWRSDVAAERRDIVQLLAASPSLERDLAAGFAEGYRLGRLRAAAETGIAVAILPKVPPFTLEQARDEDLMPLEPSLELYRRPPRTDDHVTDDP